MGINGLNFQSNLLKIIVGLFMLIWKFQNLISNCVLLNNYKPLITWSTTCTVYSRFTSNIESRKSPEIHTVVTTTMILFIIIRFWSTPSKFWATRIGTVRIAFARGYAILDTWIIWATAAVPTYPINVDGGGYPVNKHINLRFRGRGRFRNRGGLWFWIRLGFTFCTYKISNNVEYRPSWICGLNYSYYLILYLPSALYFVPINIKQYWICIFYCSW